MNIDLKQLTDCELIERAALAAALGKPYEWGGWPDPKKPAFINEQNDIVFFDPLTDDGDALRLAIKLDMALDLDEHPRATTPWAESMWADFPPAEDKAAAVRRCIVSAAAALADNQGKV
jgi:hypothetical protein